MTTLTVDYGDDYLLMDGVVDVDYMPQGESPFIDSSGLAKSKALVGNLSNKEIQAYSPLGIAPSDLVFTLFSNSLDVDTYLFDGTDDYVQYPAITGLVSPLWIFFTARLDDTSVDWARIIQNNTLSNLLGFSVARYSTTTNRLHITTDNTIWSPEISGLDMTDGFHRYGILWDDALRELYIDDPITPADRSTTENIISSSTDPVILGFRDEPVDRFWKGEIQDVRIVQGTLTDQQRIAIMRHELPSGVSYELLDQSIDGTDTSGNSRDGTLNGDISSAAFTLPPHGGGNQARIGYGGDVYTVLSAERQVDGHQYKLICRRAA